MTDFHVQEDILDHVTVRELLLTRRRMMQLSVGGAACISLSACLPLLAFLRIGMRGRLIGRGMRTARSSRSGRTSTLGRQAAASIQLYRLARGVQTLSRLQRLGEIQATEDDETATYVETDATDTDQAHNYVDGIRICTTRAERNHFDHDSAIDGGHIGTSAASPDGEMLQHKDFVGKIIATDVYERNRIRHLDAERNLLGETHFRIVELPSDRSRYEVTDDSYLRRELDRLNDQSTAEDRAILRRLSGNIAAQTDCINSPGSVDCTSAAERASEALKRAEEHFSRKG